NGSTYTLVCIGDTYEIVCENYDDKGETLRMLDELQVGGGEAAMETALLGAQSAFAENSGLDMYLFTDKSYSETENITVVNLSNVTENYAISDFTYTTNLETVTVTANVISYESDKELTVEFYKDGEEKAISTQNISLVKGEKTPIEPIVFNGTFHKIEALILDSDGQKLDNSSLLFSEESQNAYRVLLVSDQPFFLESALKVAGTAAIEKIETEDYAGQSGYDLYIFDCFNPQTMPKDGAVWLFNLDGNLPQSGFSAYGENQLENGGKLNLSTSTATLVQTLTKDLSDTPVYIDSYQKYGALQYSSNFQILYTYNRSPMIFIGENGYGNREVVFAFDLHKSNFPLTYDYTVLIRNILEYSFPKVLDKYTYDCGETLAMNAAPDCQSIEIISPSGEKELKTLNTIDNYRLAEVGVYTITMNTNSDSRTYNVYVQLPETERAPLQTEAEFRINGEATDGRTDGKYDKLILIFALLSVMFIADWVVYCYDKYQLR
ncbi:MAG: VWA domain-containing protein, partial [Clostridia bacterium]|nr:VWA domain-containing protein [Clostridia bacterium]